MFRYPPRLGIDIGPFRLGVADALAGHDAARLPIITTAQLFLGRRRGRRCGSLRLREKRGGQAASKHQQDLFAH